jgi:surface antigen
LPESTAVANQAQSAEANEAMASDTDNIVSKPEVVTTALKSRADIFNYTAQSNDSVASLAQKFGVTSNSIMWSNGLTSNTINAGKVLTIPPVNGIVYTVKTGDTPASLAQKYGANQQEIIAYNDAEISGLKVGEQIIIPNGQVQTASYSSPSLSAASWGGPTYGYNGYDFGYCTWYVATQVAVPSNWGNASSWAYYASMSGWNVSTTPTVGAVAQTALAAGGEGHVAVVDGVNGDMIHIKDMNNYGDGGGWDRVGGGWVTASTFQHFITP